MELFKDKLKKRRQIKNEENKIRMDRRRVKIF